jgi:hypothetical protein
LHTFLSQGLLWSRNAFYESFLISVSHTSNLEVASSGSPWSCALCSYFIWHKYTMRRLWKKSPWRCSGWCACHWTQSLRVRTRPRRWNINDDKNPQHTVLSYGK